MGLEADRVARWSRHAVSFKYGYRGFQSGTKIVGLSQVGRVLLAKDLTSRTPGSQGEVQRFQESEGREILGPWLTFPFLFAS